jgi:hypothetical protein
MSLFERRGDERGDTGTYTTGTSHNTLLVLSSFTTAGAAAAPALSEEMEVVNDTYQYVQIRDLPRSFVSYSNLAGDIEVQGVGNEKDKGGAAASATSAASAEDADMKALVPLAPRGSVIAPPLPWNHKEHGLLVSSSATAREANRDFQCLPPQVETCTTSRRSSFPALLVPVVLGDHDAAPEKLKDSPLQPGQLVLSLLQQQELKSVEGETSTMIEEEQEEEEVPQFLKKLTEILGSSCFDDIVHWSLGELPVQ